MWSLCTWIITTSRYPSIYPLTRKSVRVAYLRRQSSATASMPTSWCFAFCRWQYEVLVTDKFVVANRTVDDDEFLSSRITSELSLLLCTMSVLYVGTERFRSVHCSVTGELQRRSLSAKRSRHRRSFFAWTFRTRRHRTGRLAAFLYV